MGVSSSWARTVVNPWGLQFVVGKLKEGHCIPGVGDERERAGCAFIIEYQICTDSENIQSYGRTEDGCGNLNHIVPVSSEEDDISVGR